LARFLGWSGEQVASPSSAVQQNEGQLLLTADEGRTHPRSPLIILYVEILDLLGVGLDEAFARGDFIPH
jgi:hypothetical protein